MHLLLNLNPLEDTVKNQESRVGTAILFFVSLPRRRLSTYASRFPVLSSPPGLLQSPPGIHDAIPPMNKTRFLRTLKGQSVSGFRIRDKRPHPA